MNLHYIGGLRPPVIVQHVSVPPTRLMHNLGHRRRPPLCSQTLPTRRSLADALEEGYERVGHLAACIANNTAAGLDGQEPEVKVTQFRYHDLGCIVSRWERVRYTLLHISLFEDEHPRA